MVLSTATPSRPPILFSISANAGSRVPKALSAQARPVLSPKPAIAPVHPADVQNVRLVSMIGPLDFFALDACLNRHLRNRSRLLGPLSASTKLALYIDRGDLINQDRL